MTGNNFGSSGMFWGKIIGLNVGAGRAYSPGPGESVTRGDRRGRELWFGSPSPPLAGPCESPGARLVLDVLGLVLLKFWHERHSVI
jgi:hypothetical protein